LAILINKLHELPILYSFRRCPYAIRTRMVLYACGIECELREVVLKNKPQAMLDVSPKATVPVLVTPSVVIDESIDIIRWALECTDNANLSTTSLDDPLVSSNDSTFKYYLVESRFKQEGKPYLDRSELSALDLAIFPFIRQFAFVDKETFDNLPYPLTQQWLSKLLESGLFKAVMKKYPAWQPGQAPLIFGQH